VYVKNNSTATPKNHVNRNSFLTTPATKLEKTKPKTEVAPSVSLLSQTKEPLATLSATATRHGRNDEDEFSKTAVIEPSFNIDELCAKVLDLFLKPDKPAFDLQQVSFLLNLKRGIVESSLCHLQNKSLVKRIYLSGKVFWKQT